MILQRARADIFADRLLQQCTPLRAALTTAIELYRAMDMTFWLPQAEASLAQRGHDRL